MTEKHHLTAIIEKEGSGYVALCPELDIASQGETEEEALELHFEPPQATRPPKIRTIEVEVGAA